PVKKKYGIKPILASVLVTAALATPMVVLSIDAVPTWDAELIFEGARLEYKEVDGETTIQAIFNVAVDKVVNGTGASFYLDYNPDYLTPSDMETNRPLTDMATDEFFSADSNLFQDKDGNAIFPFVKMISQNESYSSLDLGSHQIHMDLRLDQSKTGVIATNGGGKSNENDGVETLRSATTYDLNEKNYVFNLWKPLTYRECDEGEEEWPEKEAKKVVLGQISFQVTRERLPEIVKYFGSMDAILDYSSNATPPRANYETINLLDGRTEETYLLDASHKFGDNEDRWQISAFGGTDVSGHSHPHLYQMQQVYYNPDRSDVHRENVAEHYIFNFPKDIIIDVEATNPELVINAYQNFHKSLDRKDDLPLSLGVYSPMVTVTYADGSKENIPFPWGRTEDEYKAYHVSGGRYTQEDVNDWLTANPGQTADDCPFTLGAPKTPVTTGNYDPTGGDYWFAQYYNYQVDGTDGDGNPTKLTVRFPKRVTAHMTVTPITVLDVTADDAERTYALGRVVNEVRDVDDLELPTQARIITDIVPSGVSLVTRIKGWTPYKKNATGSAWPDPIGNLHALKADTATTANPKPYWPDITDISPLPENHVGTYTFAVSDENHKDEIGILREDIQADFPWLTVPEKSYPLNNVKRHIVADEDYADAEKYTAAYERTVTNTSGDNVNGNGQPTLTLSVRRVDQDIAVGSIFRIWLPNGQEIGTGQKRGNVPDMENWFGDTRDDPTVGDPTKDDYAHGYYDPGTRLTGGSDEKYFELDINPGDPTKDDYRTQRETLRRYINLGGWYYVSICEDPDGTDPTLPDGWTDRIPVYVPPRRNEYTENKVYNFIAENAALFNWPGGVKDTLYLPHGSYTPVGPVDTASGVGLPLYNKDGVAVDALYTPGAGESISDIFENANPMRPLLERYQESYGVSTIYDGQTGAQPGEIFTVKVTENPWSKMADGVTHAMVGADPIYKYGPTPIYNGVQIMSFGYVYQPLANTTAYKATLRTQMEEKPTQIEKIKLVSIEPTGITREVQNDLDSNVTLATYDTKVEGYTVRQDYLFTIKNVGDVDIYGLDIDGLTDGYPTDQTGGRFEMLQPPASFLPAGGSTTFVLTYVYDLRGQDSGPLNYRDTLYITSTSHPTPGKYDEDGNLDNHGDYLLDFDAQFAVSRDPLHKVTVIYKPTDGTMGTAGLIVGEQSNGTTTTMNYAATAQTFPQGDVVYVVVNKLDEYDISSVTLDDGAGNPVIFNDVPVNIVEYLKDGGDPALIKDDHTVIYRFTMPDQDVTVTVNFFEPLKSKLRLSSLIEYSAPHTNDDLKNAVGDTVSAPHTFQVWRKTFTDDERAKAATWQGNSGATSADLYLMTKGTARPHAAGWTSAGWPAGAVPADEGQSFVSTENQYLVVIDEDFDLSQVELQLRSVQHHVDYRGEKDGDPGGYNYDIDVNVQMDVFPYGVEQNWDAPGYTSTVVYDPTLGYSDSTTGATGHTADATRHVSAAFAEDPKICPTDGVCGVNSISPKAGESTYVRITLSGRDRDEEGNVIGGVEYRYYY
ncbi:MAG: hypothetical protein NC311_16390, partial [Muribaculaceae bacterium]|nr:hypothetical protein [Muribaculaceae bacterium]